MKKAVIVSFVFFFFVILTGCKKAEVLSFRRTWEIIIDGDDSDWPDTCIHYLAKPGQAVCFANDDSFFYVLIRISDSPTILSLLSHGATIWFTPEKKSRFGLRYPTGLGNKGAELTTIKDFPRFPDRSADPRKILPENKNRLIDPRLVEIAQKEMEIIIPANNIKQLLMSVLSKSYGIDAKFLFNGERFVYELKIPLNKISSYDYFLDVGDANRIYLVIKSEPAKSKTGNGNSILSDFGGDMPEGRSSGAPPQRGSSGMRGTSPGGMAQTENLELKFDVVLSQ